MRDESIGVVVSDDCGGYVCNAVNHAVLNACPDTGLFVHVPADALPGTAMFSDVLRLLNALLARMVGVSPAGLHDRGRALVDMDGAS